MVSSLELAKSQMNLPIFFAVNVQFRGLLPKNLPIYVMLQLLPAAGYGMAGKEREIGSLGLKAELPETVGNIGTKNMYHLGTQKSSG
jgi:hypothetical protein